MSDADDSYTRRLPVYILVDCSGSMAGEPIAAMQMGIKALISALQEDPQAVDTVWLSIITFDSDAEQVLPLTDIREVAAPPLDAGGTTALGQALTLLDERMEDEVRTYSEDQKADWKPLAFIFTDGAPTDDWKTPVHALKSQNKITVIACGAGPEVNTTILGQIGHKNVRLDNTQPETLMAFLQWVTASVTATSKSLGTRAKSGETFAELPDVIKLVPGTD